uniref:BZIP transcription factor 5 n=1 Tax=Chlorella sp. HS2 TaxID=2675547 RepID=A0A8E4MM94_9CHLO|nr:bZIP transcription factor 5 [Chlorella sp. HS2]
MDAAGMEWDLDVDAFLDDYLKELGPEAQGPDHFGNIAFDFAPTTTQAGVLGAWGPSAPAASVPADSTAHQAPTMLTGQLQAAHLDSQQQEASSSGAIPQAAAQQQQQQSAAGVAAASAAAAAAAASSGGTATGRAASTGGSRGGRETKKELDMKRHLALQEKNRRAQRRFRERQKQRVAELEEQVATLQAQLAAVTSSQQAAAPMPVQGPAGSAAAVRLAPSGGDTMQPDGAKKEAHASPRAPSSGSPHVSDEEPVLPSVSFSDALTLTVKEGHPVQLTARELADMTPAELAKYYKAYVNELAGILVESDNPGSQATQVRTCAVDAARLEPPGWPLQERVRRLVDEVCLLSTRAALCNPPGSKHFALTKVDDVPGQPADARVPQIARALDITASQRRQLGQLRSLFLQKLGRIAGDRREINAQLVGAVPGGTGNRHLCTSYLAAHDSARRLRESLREEHILVLDFISTIYKHVRALLPVLRSRLLCAHLFGLLQAMYVLHLCVRSKLIGMPSDWVLPAWARQDQPCPLPAAPRLPSRPLPRRPALLACPPQVFTSQQVAQFMIQSYPWTPDCLALCTWVAAEDGDAEALSLLAADAQSKQQAAAAAAASAAAPGVPQASSGCSGGSGNTLSVAPVGVPTPGTVASVGLPGGPGAPMFLPTAFASAGMPVGAPAGMMFGQPMMVAAGGGMVAGFNPLVHAQAGSGELGRAFAGANGRSAVHDQRLDLCSRHLLPSRASRHQPGGTQARQLHFFPVSSSRPPADLPNSLAPADPTSMGMPAMLGQRWIPGAAPCMQSAGMHQPITASGSGCLPIPLGLPQVAAAGSAGTPGAPGFDLGPGSGGACMPISPHVGTVSSANGDL